MGNARRDNKPRLKPGQLGRFQNRPNRPILRIQPDN